MPGGTTTKLTQLGVKEVNVVKGYWAFWFFYFGLYLIYVLAGILFLIRGNAASKRS